jgi:hypothetical protein
VSIAAAGPAHPTRISARSCLQSRQAHVPGSGSPVEKTVGNVVQISGSDPVNRYARSTLWRWNASSYSGEQLLWVAPAGERSLTLAIRAV